MYKWRVRAYLWVLHFPILSFSTQKTQDFDNSDKDNLKPHISNQADQLVFVYNLTWTIYKLMLEYFDLVKNMGN